jgi:hypothetical protein
VAKANPVAFEFPQNPHTIITIQSPANLSRWETGTTLTVSLNLSLWYPSYIFSNPFYNYTYTCSLSSFEYVIDAGKYRFSLFAGDTALIIPENLQTTSQAANPAPQFLKVSKNLDLGFLADGNHTLQVKTTTDGHYYKGGQEHWDPIYDKSDTFSFFIGRPTITSPSPTPAASPSSIPTAPPTQQPTLPTLPPLNDSTPTPPTSLTPSPSVPEFPALVFLPVCILTLAVAVLVLPKRKH